MTEQEETALRDGRDFPVSGTFPPPKGGWLCFHCNERFMTWGTARDHFGASPVAVPGCSLKVKFGDERGLLMKLRDVEHERDELQVRLTAARLGLDKEGEADAIERFRVARKATHLNQQFQHKEG